MYLPLPHTKNKSFVMDAVTYVQSTCTRPETTVSVGLRNICSVRKIKILSNTVIILLKWKPSIFKNKTCFETSLKEVLQKNLVVSWILSLSYSWNWFQTERDGIGDSVKQALVLRRVLPRATQVVNEIEPKLLIYNHSTYVILSE